MQKEDKDTWQASHNKRARREVITMPVTRLRKQEGNVSCRRVRVKSGLYNVSLWTINRTLKEMGYAFLEARKKRILLKKDFKEL